MCVLEGFEEEGEVEQEEGKESRHLCTLSAVPLRYNPFFPCFYAYYFMKVILEPNPKFVCANYFVIG